MSLRDQALCEAFVRWFDTNGHHVYRCRCEALDAWCAGHVQTFGAAPHGARQTLQGWCQRDPHPAQGPISAVSAHSSDAHANAR